MAAGPNRTFDEKCGTMAHELTHMAMEISYENDCDPYGKWDEHGRDIFRNICDNIFKNRGAMNRGALSETLLSTFHNYEESEYHSELIARVPHILLQFKMGKMWLQNIRERIIRILPKYRSSEM